LAAFTAACSDGCIPTATTDIRSTGVENAAAGAKMLEFCRFEIADGL